jgi:hypothetical protein
MPKLQRGLRKGQSQAGAAIRNLRECRAFKAHLETPHFKKYAETTKDMVKSRKRIDNVPITLNVKGK